MINNRILILDNLINLFRGMIEKQNAIINEYEKAIEYLESEKTTVIVNKDDNTCNCLHAAIHYQNTSNLHIHFCDGGIGVTCKDCGTTFLYRLEDFRRRNGIK